MRSFFYWLTFLFTALFIFLFFSIGLSRSVGVQMFYAKSDIPTNLMLLSVILCAVEIFFANDFYVRQKAKELSVMLICGARYYQLAGFLLIQTFFLSATAILCAVGIGIMMIPVLEAVFSQWTGASLSIAIEFNAVVWTSLVIGYVLLWTLVFNLAFAYRNSAAQLLNEERIKIRKEKLLSVSFHINDKVKKILSLICFLLPVIGYYQSRDYLLPCSLISLIGLHFCIQNIVSPAIEKEIKNHIDDGGKVAVLGFLRNDLSILKMNLYLLILCMILLVSLLLSAVDPLDRIMTMIAYIAMNLLLCMSLCFRCATEMINRRKSFDTLSDLGFSDEQKKQICSREMAALFGFVFLIVLFYISNMSAGVMIQGLIQNPLFLFASALFPVVISGFISRLIYGIIIKS